MCCASNSVGRKPPFQLRSHPSGLGFGRLSMGRDIAERLLDRGWEEPPSRFRPTFRPNTATARRARSGRKCIATWPPLPGGARAEEQTWRPPSCGGNDNAPDHCPRLLVNQPAERDIMCSMAIIAASPPTMMAADVTPRIIRSAKRRHAPISVCIL
jgi:hypothetical protein